MTSVGSSLSSAGVSSARGNDLRGIRQSIDIAGSSAKASDESQVKATTSLTAAQLRQVGALQQTDRSVRQHEQAHVSAGQGLITSGPSYEYTYGPDGKQYAVGGEVGIDTSAEEKPEANIEKGQRIQAAALAPADPSPQDYRVASIGGKIEQKGYADLNALRLNEPTDRTESKPNAGREDQARRVEQAPPSSPFNESDNRADLTRRALERTYAIPSDRDGAGRISFLAG